VVLGELFLSFFFFFFFFLIQYSHAAFVDYGEPEKF
jgi:hypothetical protein